MNFGTYYFQQRSAALALTYIKRVEAPRPALSIRQIKALDQVHDAFDRVQEAHRRAG